MPSPQFSMWLLTVPVADFVSTDALPNNVKYIKGQQEVGAGTGYQHWQLFVSTTRMTLVALKRIFPTAHIEPLALSLPKPTSLRRILGWKALNLKSESSLSSVIRKPIGTLCAPMLRKALLNPFLMMFSYGMTPLSYILMM